MFINRRKFGGLIAAPLLGASLPQIADSAGPLKDMPAGAIDAHNHLVGPRSKYPMYSKRTYTPPEASVAQLRAVRKELGIARNVIVQPSFYGFDNSCVLDALKDLGTSARGVAVVPLDVKDAELKRLAAGGMTGVRLNLSTFGISDPKQAADAIHSFGPRLRALHWHIEVNTSLLVIDELAPMIADAEVPIVIDHFGNGRAEKGVTQKGFGALLELVKARNTYVKLCAPYNLSKRSDWADVVPLAKALIAAGADRMVWGSNWPHPGTPPPGNDIRQITPFQVIDNRRLLTHFALSCPDPAIRKMILVDTPAHLYQFA